MGKKEITASAKKELQEHLIARYKQNGGSITYGEMVKEAIFTAAVNSLQVKNEIGYVDQETTGYMFEAFNETLLELFPKSFKKGDIDEIKMKYEILMNDVNVKSIVNQHFNDLYSTTTKYV